MMEKNTLFLEFIKAISNKEKLKIPARIEQILEFEETVIRKEYDKVSKDKTKQKKVKEYLTEQFQGAFLSLNRQEKVQFYVTQIDTMCNLVDGTLQPLDQQLNKDKQTEVFVKGQIRGWNKKLLRVNRTELCIELQRPGKIKKHDLYNYIYRKSKNNDYFGFVLESINNVPQSKYKTIHLGFVTESLCNEWLAQVKTVIDFARAKVYAQELGLGITGKKSQGIIKAPSVGNLPAQDKPLPVSTSVPNIQSPPSIKKVPSQKNQEKKELPKELPKEVQKEPVQKKDSNPSSNSSPVKSPQKEVETEKQKPTDPHISKKQSKIVDRIIKEQIDGQELQNLATEYNENPKAPNLIDQILPDYPLEKIDNDDGYKTLEYENKYRLMQSQSDPQSFKIFINFSFPAEIVFANIINLQTFKVWNTEVDEVAVKTLISSENTAIVYLKIKAYSRIYRARDFIFLRHAFRKDGDIFVIDKSIQNVNYPPFLTIVRGKLQTVWGVLPNADNTQCLLVIDTKISHEGYINQQQNTNLSKQYLKKLLNIQTYIVQKSFGKEDGLTNMFDIGPAPAPQNKMVNRKISPIRQQSLLRYKSFNQKIEEEDSKVSEQSTKMEPQKTNEVKEVKKEKVEETKPEQPEVGQISPDQIPPEALTKNMRVPELDAQGMSIISQNFVKTKYRLVPWERQLVYETNWVGNHHIWRDEWRVDNESGGCWFVNEQKMAEQRKVFSYILSKIGKNILGGKGILNISLPVDVFSCQSNLETLAKAFAFAPVFLQKAATINQPLEQMKYVIAFGFTNSLLYAKMQKPFNPILGQTLQCSFRGCPLYLEQVSHHPPIASFYMVGRGYRFYGSIESKMDLSINSGTGYNAGDGIVKFDNGTEIRFRTPGGEISGLTYGQRKLLLNNKSFYWEPNLGYMLDISFNPGKKGFFSLSKQEIPADYFEGTVKKVKKQFIQQFQEKKTVFKPAPTSKDIIQEIYKVHGQWTKQVIIDGKSYYNVDNDKYVKYELEPNPLPSDCMYREDVVYKRLGNIARSQNEKERLEVLQRKDKKLREKPSKK